MPEFFEVVRAFLLSVPLIGPFAPVLPVAPALDGPELWGVNSTVFAQARSGNTLYLGGDFGGIGPSTGGGVPLEPGSGAPIRPFPRVCGSVSAAVPDGAGGWFIGGVFSAVEGAPRSNVAHVQADGTLSPWHPTVAGVEVVALAKKGRVLFVGGNFSSVNGTPRMNLAAVDVVTGALLDWDPRVEGEVRSLVLHDRSLFVGGGFESVGGQPRSNLARLDASTGAVLSWLGSTDGRVWTMAIDQDVLFVGGEFDHAGVEPRNSLAALDLRTGSVNAWNARLGPRRFVSRGWSDWPYVATLAARRGVLYVGGWFTHVGDLPRQSLTALDVRTAEPATLDAGFTERMDVVTALVVQGSTLYLGGGYAAVQGAVRNNLAALDLNSGSVTSWNPRALEQSGTRNFRFQNVRIKGVIDALAAGDRTVYAGGRFMSMYEWKPRVFLAAIDLSTGRATDWAPEGEGNGVTALEVLGNRVYMTGWFRKINGIPKDNLAAVDATRGELVDWGPTPASTGTSLREELPGTEGAASTFSHFIPRIAIRDGAVYASGGFVESITGRERFHVAAFDAQTGSLLPWNPLADGPLHGMLLSGTTLYAGGLFSNFGSVRHPWLGAVDVSSAQARPWDPKPLGDPFSPAVAAFARQGDVLFLGGQFVSMGGAARSNIAAVDPVTGAVLPWDPHAEGGIFALTTYGHTVWAAGGFSRIGGRDQSFLAALDESRGLAQDVQPRVDGTVHALMTSGKDLYIVGEFHSVNGIPHGGVARIRAGLDPAANAANGTGNLARSASLRVVSTSPDRARGNTVLTFSLAQAGHVKLDVFDLQGRRVASVLDRVWLPAGTHEASLPTESLGPGVYLYRLDALGASVANKVFVVH